jgi:hypothetical protein
MTVRYDFAISRRKAPARRIQANAIASKHKAGYGYREESIGYKIMVAHGTWTCRALEIPGRLHEYDYRHDAQSKGLRGVTELGIRLML